MKKFERFIIYPLLIVALFYAITGGAGTETLANPFASLIDDVIRAREVRVYNDNDEVVGIFGESDIDSGGALSIFNSSGNVIATISQNADKAGTLNVFNQDGHRVNSITSKKDGTTGQIAVFNEREELLAIMSSDANNHGLIIIYDKYGEDGKGYSFR